ncbi:hypothetical protein SAMN05216353_11752 [Halobacillus alkaliphilus]|uniref:Helix-turn-helix domain-containing protein n=1 Tax=Halobacillus alkaliphilus TaxID=396056 RepID=A0A1I2NBM3_9BACI|nr:hypothetical protein [Halobacillus alkaliphilus]SFF98886.1 hypothetical protein SAMN05216353_11752 [Halobacillus alkaliphilus]
MTKYLHLTQELYNMLNTKELMIIYAIYFHGNDEQTACMEIKTLSKKTNLTKEDIEQNISTLMSKGYYGHWFLNIAGGGKQQKLFVLNNFLFTEEGSSKHD